MSIENITLKGLERRALVNDFDCAGILVGYGLLVATNRYCQRVRGKGCGGRIRINRRKVKGKDSGLK